VIFFIPAYYNDTLNADQRKVVDAIEERLAAHKRGARCDAAVLMLGPAGTGKSTVFNYMDRTVRGRGGTVVRMAPTGMAATNIRGRTAHSVLGLPCDLNDESTSIMLPSQQRFRTLQTATLILFDEVAMASFHYFRIMHQVMCHARGFLPNCPTAPLFGGVPVLLGGDFRQLGPVPSGGRTTSELHFRNWIHFKR